jgi:thiamine biosynthesis lipoprotein
MKKRAQPWLGTLVEIAIADALPADQLEPAFRAGFARVAALHELLSFHSADSELSRINRAPVGAVLDISPDTHAVLQAAQQLHLASAGLFDVRVASRLALWGYLPPPALPIPAYEPSRQAYTLQTEQGCYRLHKLTDDWLDLGGIAKGYAVDQVLAVLQQAGVREACVNAGGDLRVCGEQAWQIGIRDPQRPASMARSIAVQQQALATSACYFSQKEEGGRRTSALVHGLSGEALVAPVSVSVLAPQCLWADALTKVVLATGDAAHPCLGQFQAQAFII